MSDLNALNQLRERSHFDDWKGTVPDEAIAASAGSINHLIDDVVKLGAEPDEDDVRNSVGECVSRFNDLDNEVGGGWITTIEREDISDLILRVITLTGFVADDDWIADREW